MNNVSFKNKILQRKGSLYLNDEPDVNVQFPVRKVSELEKTIYSINPVTGLPDSDLSIMNDTKVSPTLRSAIQNSTKVYSPNAPSSFDDDVVLDSVQQPFESKSDYYDRLQDSAKNTNIADDSQ